MKKSKITYKTEKGENTFIKPKKEHKLSEIAKRDIILYLAKLYHNSSYFEFEDFEKLVNFILIEEKEEEIEKIQTARRCLNYQGYYCENRDCKNKFCPLNKFWEKEK